MRGFNLQGTHLNMNLAFNLATVSRMTVDRLCNQPSMMDLFFPIKDIFVGASLYTCLIDDLRLMPVVE